MEDKIILDRETFKVLAVDTRVKILKILDERQHTLTDLAEELGMAPSTIKEHLDRLVSAGLIKQVDKGMKWKYYRLTSKGGRILNPYEKKVWIVLATTLVALTASVYTLLTHLQTLVTPVSWGVGALKDVAPATDEMKAGNYARHVADNVSREAGDFMSKSGGVVSTTIPPELTTITTAIPYTELFIVILFALVLGVCVGYLIKKKKII